MTELLRGGKLPPAGLDRALIALLATGQAAVALLFVLSSSESLISTPTAAVSSVTFPTGAAAMLWWAAAPTSRRAYAASVALSSVAYLSRAVIMVDQLIQGTPVPLSLSIAAVIWVSMALFTLLAWRQFEPRRSMRE